MRATYRHPLDLSLLVLYGTVLALASRLVPPGELGNAMPYDASVVARCLDLLDQGLSPWRYTADPVACFYPPIGYELLLRPWGWLRGPAMVLMGTLLFGLWLRATVGSWRRSWPLLLSGQGVFALLIEGNPMLGVLALGFGLPGAGPLLGPLALAVGVALKPTVGALFCLYWLPRWWLRERRAIWLFTVGVTGLLTLGVLLSAWRFGSLAFLGEFLRAAAARNAQSQCAQWSAGAPLTNLPCALFGLSPLWGPLLGVPIWLGLLLWNVRRLARGEAPERVRRHTLVWGALGAPLLPQPALPAMVAMPFYQTWGGALYSWAVVLLCVVVPVAMAFARGEGVSRSLSDNLYLGAMVPLALLPEVVGWMVGRRERRS